MIRDLPLLSGQAKAEPRHDPWPPTWRLPSGAIRVEASFKEPGRQKLVNKATKAVAFLALAFIVLGHELWPWSQLVALALNFIAGPGSIPTSEQAAAWLLVAAVGVGTIVATSDCCSQRSGSTKVGSHSASVRTPSASSRSRAITTGSCAAQASNSAWLR